jgi:hypothetical protein
MEPAMYGCSAVRRTGPQRLRLSARTPQTTMHTPSGWLDNKRGRRTGTYSPGDARYGVQSSAKAVLRADGHTQRRTEQAPCRTDYDADSYFRGAPHEPNYMSGSYSFICILGAGTPKSAQTHISRSPAPLTQFQPRHSCRRVEAGACNI